MDDQVTAFGAAFAAPPQTAGILRARAAAAGLETRPAVAEDLLVAVVAAQACVAALGVGSVNDVRGRGPSGALAAIYCRAGGRAAHPVPSDPADVSALIDDLAVDLACTAHHELPQTTLSAIACAAEWAREHGAGAGVLAAAAEDLSAGWAHPAIAAASDALITLAADH